MHHGRIGPSGGAFRRDDRGDRRLVGLEKVDLVGPRAGSDDAFVGEIVGLDGGVVPVALDERVLLAEQIEDGLVLRLVQFIGVLDAEAGLVFIR
jgi:hypothetical protein